MYSRLGRPDRARALLVELEGRLTPTEKEDVVTMFDMHLLESDVARAEGKYMEALAISKAACDPFRKAFSECDAAPTDAELYDLAGQRDSALAVYERYLANEENRQIPQEVWYPRALRRAGQLQEAKGNREKALEYYGKFVNLYKDADPVLQPLVRETRGWIAQLAGERR
jgi:tetratricopeptide (TPR) repeat protein